MGRGRALPATLLHLETRSPVITYQTHWTHWACGCLSRMFECLTREYFCRIYEWAVNDCGCCILSSSWILPLNFTQMAPTPGQPFILTWLITNFRECSEFLPCSRADIKEPDCSFWDQGDSFSSPHYRWMRDHLVRRGLTYLICARMCARRKARHKNF